MRRPSKVLAFVLLVLVLLGSLSALAESAAGYTAAELSVLLTSYLSPSGDNYGSPLPGWLKAYFGIENADRPSDTPKATAAAESPAVVASAAPTPKATQAPVTPAAEEVAVQPEVLVASAEEAPQPAPTPLTSRIVMPAEGAAAPAVVSTRLAAYVLPIIAEASAEELPPEEEEAPEEEETIIEATMAPQEPIFELSAFEPKPTAEAESTETTMDVEAVPAPASGPFTVQALNFLDTEIHGTGLPGYEITAYVSGEILTATVDDDGTWKIELPDWIFLMEGNEIRVTHAMPVEESEESEAPEAGEAAEEGAEATDTADTTVPAETAEPEIPAIEEIRLFVSRKQSMQPTVGDFDNTMTIISGTGVPYARITVAWPDDTLSVYEPVMLTGYWGIETAAGKWKVGDKISVIQQETNMQPSEPRTITVVEQSPQPVVNPLKVGDAQITGAGVSGASISIQSGAGFNGSATVARDATTWSYDIPEGITLSAGSVVRLYQKVPGKTQSDWFEVTVQAP